MTYAIPSRAHSTRAVLPALRGITDTLSPLVEPALRVATGLMLVPHGAQKLFGWFGGYGVEATGQFFAAKLGLPPSLALIAGLIEFVGGLMLAVGLLTRPIAALVAAVMAGAILTVHLPAGYFWTDGGYEYPLMWGLLALAFVIRGGGRTSLDALIGREI